MKNKIKKIATICSLLLCSLVLKINVYASTTCQEGKTYYNFYLFTEDQTGKNTINKGVNIKLNEPYNYFKDPNVLYTIQNEGGQFGMLPVPINGHSGTALSMGKDGNGQTRYVYTGGWTIDDWLANFKRVYWDDIGFTKNNSSEHAAETVVGNNIIRFIVAGNSANVANGPSASLSDYRTAWNKVSFAPGTINDDVLDQGYTDDKNLTANKFINLPTATYIAFTTSADGAHANPAKNIANASDFPQYHSEFAGDSVIKKFKIYRSYNNVANTDATRKGIYALAKIEHAKCNGEGDRWDQKEYNKTGKGCWTYHVYYPAVYLIKYTCRKPCTTACCYDERGVNGGYHSNYKETDSDIYNHYKYVLKGPNPGRGAAGSVDVTKKTATDINKNYELKTCGCDPSTECCYDSNGRRQGSYDNKSKVKGDTQKNPVYHYKWVEKGKNVGYLADGTVDVGDGTNVDTSKYELKTCGCQPEKTCCYDSSGNLERIFGVPGYGYLNKNDHYAKIDDSASNSPVVMCYCKASDSKPNCDSNTIGTFDEVAGNSNDTACLIKGKYTDSGFSLLSSGQTEQSVGYDITCKDSYSIEYPGNQEGTKDGYARWFVVKNKRNELSLAKLTITRTCLSTRLKVDSTLRRNAYNRINSTNKLPTDNDGARLFSSFTLTYNDDDDIENRSSGLTKNDFNIEKVSSSSNLYYYSNSNAAVLPEGTANGTLNSSTYSSAYYMKRVETVSYNVKLPSIYLTGSKGNTTLSQNNGIAQLPTHSLPVMFTTPAGTYKYKIYTQFSNASLNRSSTDYTANRDSTRHVPSITNSKATYNGSSQSDGYSCNYNVKREVKIHPATYLYRTISLSAINPQGRLLGDNWNKDNASIRITASSNRHEKQKKIDALRISNPSNVQWSLEQRLKDSNENYSVLTEEKKSFTFVLNPVTMKMIRNYNSQRREEGGYNDWGLVACDYKGADINDANVVFTKRYQQSSVNYGWHWYSGFLSCLVDGDYCSYTARTVDDCTGAKYNAQVNADLYEAFRRYGVYAPDSGTMSMTQLRNSRKDLIKKQNQLDNAAYNSSRVGNMD